MTEELTIFDSDDLLFVEDMAHRFEVGGGILEPEEYEFLLEAAREGVKARIWLDKCREVSKENPKAVAEAIPEIVEQLQRLEFMPDAAERQRAAVLIKRLGLDLLQEMPPLARLGIEERKR